MHLVTLATCSLNQWALDFVGNQARILQSILEAKAAGASWVLLILPLQTLYRLMRKSFVLDPSWRSLARAALIISWRVPVKHRNVLYNCRIISYNKKICLIRPKLSLANDVGVFYLCLQLSEERGLRCVGHFSRSRLFRVQVLCCNIILTSWQHTG